MKLSLLLQLFALTYVQESVIISDEGQCFLQFAMFERNIKTDTP